MGVVGARKPERVLELGFGAGYTTTAVLNALEWNGCGNLTVIDNWHDWNGQEPVELTDPFRKRHVTFITSNERDFTKSAASESYDIIIADADHCHSNEWCADHLRMATPGGILFWHDVTNPDFPNLADIQREVAHLPHYLFARNTRPDERCDRGWLMAIKQ
jgi:predicted O-methyltransferase YrrM